MADEERPIRRLLAQYADDHRNPWNQRIHHVCVPLILWSVVALTWPVRLAIVPVVGGVAVAWMGIVSLYYLRLSPRLAGVMLLVFASFAGASHLLWVVAGATGAWAVAGAVFIGAWAGQFVGHLIEGRRPSFLTDLQYLLIGPLWVVDKRLGIA